MKETTMTRRIPLCALLAGLIAVGCGDDKKSSDPAGEGPAGKTDPAEPQTMTTADILEGTDGPGLLGPFAPAEFGMTEDELKQAVPVFADKGDYLSAQDFGIGFFVYLDGEPKTLTSQRVTIPAADETLVVEAWGAPIELTYRREPAKLWVDDESRVRAILTEAREADELTLIIEPYLPVEAILGTEPGPMAIEQADRPFMGATAAELKAAYGEHFRDDRETLLFMQWPQDAAGSAFKMELGVGDDGTVERLQYWLHHGGNEELKKQLLGQLEAKYGASKPGKTTLGRDALFLGESTPAVRVGETEGAWVVQIE
jgi:hypothetical protein